MPRQSLQTSRGPLPTYLIRQPNAQTHDALPRETLHASLAAGRTITRIVPSVARRIVPCFSPPRCCGATSAAHLRMLAVAALLCASWSPRLHPRGLHHRHQRVIATEEASLLAQLDDLYRMLLVDGPIEIEYAPEQVADQLVGFEPSRRVVGAHVTPAGWFGLALVSLWTLYSPAGLVAYLRDARARGEELPLHLEWVPEYVWPQKHPKEADEEQAETAAQVEQSGAKNSDDPSPMGDADGRGESIDT